VGIPLSSSHAEVVDERDVDAYEHVVQLADGDVIPGEPVADAHELDVQLVDGDVRHDGSDHEKDVHQDGERSTVPDADTYPSEYS